MQVLRVQARTPQRTGLACAAACSQRPVSSLARASARRGSLLLHKLSAYGMCLVESCRRVSSTSEATQGSSNSSGGEEKPVKAEDSAARGGGEGGAATASEARRDNDPLDPAAAAAQRKAARDAIIQELISHDKVIFELKRQHELSMLRVEQNQARVLKDQEERGMYYEQNSNVHTFDTISVGLYSQRSTLYHTMSAERLRNLKIFLMVFTTFATCAYFYYRYVINPDWAYVERPMKMIGSRVQAVREQRWRMLSEEQRFEEMRKEDKEFIAQQQQ